MILTKSIEILFDLVDKDIWGDPHDLTDAIKLAIEALKRIENLRRLGVLSAGGLLPTETPK